MRKDDGECGLAAAAAAAADEMDTCHAPTFGRDSILTPDESSTGGAGLADRCRELGGGCCCVVVVDSARQCHAGCVPHGPHIDDDDGRVVVEGELLFPRSGIKTLLFPLQGKPA